MRDDDLSDLRSDRGDLVPNGLASLLGPIYTVGEAVAAIINPSRNRPLSEILGIPGVPARVSAGPMDFGGDFRLAAAAPAAIVRLPTQQIQRAGSWLLAIARRYGPAIASAVYNVYQDLKIKGLSEHHAREGARRSQGIAAGRRRMNPTNIRALRRSIRRVRSFQRVTRKVDRLLPGRRMHRHFFRGRGRRGDVSPFDVEDQADLYDEAEDLGYDPGCFYGEDLE